MTRNNALTLDEVVNLRRAAAQSHAQQTGTEVSGNDVAVPLGSLQVGHLVFTTGGTRLSITGDATQADLCRAHFGRLAPSVFVEDGLVKVFYRHSLLNWSTNTAEVTLNTSVPWRLDVVSSGASCSADLRSVPLQVLDMNGKASSIDMTLPAPTVNVPIRIAGNASNVTVRRPAGTALQVRLVRGASNVVIDGQEVSATGNKPYQTPDYADSTSRYDIEITARLSTVTIETYA